MLSVLVIEIDEQILRAAVVKRKARSFSISDYLTVERTEVGDYISGEELSGIVSRIGRCPKDIVLISPAVNMAEISIDKKRLKRLRSDQVKEVLRWEAEPYMTIPVTESLIGYEYGTGAQGEQKRIWVSMLSPEDYEGYKQACRERSLKLKKIYPADACFPIGVMHAEKEKEFVLLNIDVDIIKVVYVKKGKIGSTATFPLDSAAVQGSDEYPGTAEIELPVEEIMGDLGLSKHRLIVNCSPKADSGVIRYLDEKFRGRAEILQLWAENGDNIPQFAALLGAASRELSAGGKGIGIDDRIDLYKLIRDRIHIFPIAMMLTIIAFFLVHYLFINYQKEQAVSRKDALIEERDNIKNAQSRYSGLKKQADDLKKLNEETINKIEFLKNGSKQRKQELEYFFTALYSHSPLNLKLLEIKPLNTQGEWSIKGTSFDPASVYTLLLKLQGESWCDFVKVISITEEEKKEDAKREFAAENNTVQTDPEQFFFVEQFPVEKIEDSKDTYSFQLILSIKNLQERTEEQ